MTLDAGAAALISISRAAGRPPLEALSVEDARAAVAGGAAAIGGEVVEMADVRDVTIGGKSALTLRLYRPPNVDDREVSPALIFFHGGGWVVGDIETHDRLCRNLALAGKTRIISVDYRRAPENRFPAAVDDMVEAINWVAAHAQQLCIDPDRLGVGGDSAGGNLAAVAALMSRDGTLPKLSLQLLLYPVCDLSMSQDSYTRNAQGYLLTRDTMRYFVESYISSADDARDWRASPLHADSFCDLPPAFVLTAGYDPLCDEGQDYAHRLAASDVAVEHLHLPGQIHGMLTAAGIVVEARQAVDRIGHFLRARWE